VADEFEGEVMVWLVEDDCAVLRAYEGRSSFRTFISIVVQRMALDFRVHEWGKWHASAEAKRLGALAIDLEVLLHRDGRTLEEAVPFLRAKHEDVSLASLQALAARLPERAPRRRKIALDDAEFTPARPPDVDEPMLADERRRASQELSRLIAPIMDRLAEDDRVILQLKFGGMSVAQIARAFALDQKLTYRRVEKNLRELKRELERAGVTWRGNIADLIGHDEAFLHFDIGNQIPRPSKPGDDTEEP
jgi:RNA polymerase sigma factor for flagellar operon FliA